MRSQAIKVVLIIVASLLVLVNPAVANAQVDEGTIEEALEWLTGQQNADGGFSDGFSPESSVSTTAEVVIAVAAGDMDAGAVQSAGGASPVAFLYNEVEAGNVEGVGIVAKVAMAAVAVGLDPTDFGGQDLIAELETAYDAGTGSYGGSIFDQALVILALANADREVPQAAVDYLVANQTEDGAWSFTGETAENSGDTNTTALVIQALAATGSEGKAASALEYLRDIQNEDGGWPYQNPSDFGTETDANSTALVLEAIQALGQTMDDWQTGDADPLSALLGLQNDSGSFSFQASFPGDNALATIQAIPAVAGVTLAELPTVATSVDPGATTSPPPTTMPQAGGPAAPRSGGVLLLAAGLVSVVVGLHLSRTRLRTVRREMMHL